MNLKNTFHAYEVGIEMARVVRDVVGRIERRDGAFGLQIRRAVASVPLNVAEGNRKLGRDRVNRFRIAAGSADEVRAALEVAEALGYVAPADIAPALELVDRELAMLYRLTA